MLSPSAHKSLWARGTAPKPSCPPAAGSPSCRAGLGLPLVTRAPASASLWGDRRGSRWAGGMATTAPAPLPAAFQALWSWHREHPHERPHHPGTPAQEAESSTSARPQALTWQPRLPLSQAEIEGERGSARGTSLPCALPAAGSGFAPGVLLGKC